MACGPAPFHLHLCLCVRVCSKLKDSEERSKEMGEQMEGLKKEMEESRSRSDKGETLPRSLSHTHLYHAHLSVCRPIFLQG